MSKVGREVKDGLRGALADERQKEMGFKTNASHMTDKEVTKHPDLALLMHTPLDLTPYSAAPGDERRDARQRDLSVGLSDADLSSASPYKLKDLHPRSKEGNSS